MTGGGFADHSIPALATISLGKAALRSATTIRGADLEPDGIRVATLTIMGQIVAGTAFDPENIAERYWEVVHSDGPWRAEFRFTGEQDVEMRTVRTSAYWLCGTTSGHSCWPSMTPIVVSRDDANDRAEVNIPAGNQSGITPCIPSRCLAHSVDQVFKEIGSLVLAVFPGMVSLAQQDGHEL